MTTLTNSLALMVFISLFSTFTAAPYRVPMHIPTDREWEFPRPIDCVCSNPAWCSPLTTPLATKEFFMFHMVGANFEVYDYSKVTTIAVFNGPVEPQLVCYAHERGVRVVPGVFFPENEINDPNARATWVKNTVGMVVSLHADGVNFDLEGWTANRDNMTTLVSATKGAFMNAMPKFSITFDASFHTSKSDPGYNYVLLSDYVHAIVIMFYDLGNGFMWAAPNSPLPADKWGLNSFLSLRIPRVHLIAAFPWYGYQFPCVDNNATSPSCNVSRSYTQSSVDYKSIPGLLKSSSTGAVFDQASSSMWMNYQVNGAKFQLWYDNPQSLTIKYSWAKSENLLGIGIWHVDMLDYTDQSQMDMWSALSAFQ